MPACVECNKEVPRDEMRGPPDELRCVACAARYGEIYYAPLREVSRVRRPIVTAVVCAAAIGASLVYWNWPRYADWLPASPFAVWSGEVWRIGTTVLPHVNLIHLVFNIYWTWRFGRVLESWLGSVRYAGLVVLLAFGSSAVMFLAGENGIGLSGVGYGLFGLLFALRRTKDFAAQEMQPTVVQLFVVWFFFCIVTTYMNVFPVANVAHGAGAVLGWLTGQAILRRARVAWLIGLAVLVLVLLGATQYMPWNGTYAFYRWLHCGDPADAQYWYEKATLQNGQRLRDVIIQPRLDPEE